MRRGGMKLSILDQVPIPSGASAKSALESSIQLAIEAEKLGYHRYWVAEHHNLTGLACPNPDVMLGIIGSKTNTIRIGAGAVLLPHYKPYKVVETYHLLATLYPGRVDLGIGRAPGGSAETSIALSGNFLEQVRMMPEKLDEVMRFIEQSFPEDHLFHSVIPTPVPSVAPAVWLLGTSEKSSKTAAEKGMNYAFGHFMTEKDGPTIMKEYRDQMQQLHPNKQAESIVAISVICAETTEAAEELAMSTIFRRIQETKGIRRDGVPSLEEVKEYTFTDEDREIIEKAKQKMILGNPLQVREQLKSLQASYKVDELMIVTITHDPQARLRSYQLIAEAFSL